METIYFPACGFGFWYLLGKYERIRENQSQYILSGSSAGSLICLCSLLDFGNDDNFTENVARVASDTLDECRKQSYFLNYHNMNNIFISKLIAYIGKDYQQQITRLRIQTTKFHPPSWFEKCQIPYTVSFNVPVYNILKLPSKQTVMEMRDTAYNEPFVINRVSDGRVLIYSMSLFIGCMRPLLSML
jgi:hypothetical protein